MIQVINDKGKLLGVLFFVSFCLLMGVGVGWGADAVFTPLEINSKSVLPGTTKHLILKFAVYNNHGTDDFELTEATCTFTGTPNDAPDVSNGTVKIWAKMLTDDFSTTTLRDTTSFVTVSPNPAKAYFSGFNQQILSETTTYFYISYDLEFSVTELNIIDVEINTTTHVQVNNTTTPADIPNVVFKNSQPIDSVGIDTVTVSAAKYVIDPIGEQTAGVVFEVTTRALDGYDNTDLNYSCSPMTISGSTETAYTPNPAPDETPPYYPSPSGWSDGECVFSGVKLYCAETGRKLKVTGQWDAESNSFDVITASPDLIVSGILDPVVAGTTDFSFTVEAKDPYENEVDYSGHTICFTSTDEQAILPSNKTFTSNKEDITGLVLKTAGEQKVTATDKNNSSINGSQTVMVTHSDLYRFTINVLEGVIYPGDPFEIRIRARDPYNNIVKSFSGTVNLSTNNSEILVTPAVSGNFVGGIWQGKVYLGDYGGNIGITCDDGEGHKGLSSMVSVQTYESAHKSINYPNPFDPIKKKTTIQFYMHQEGKVKIKIYAPPTGDLVNEWEISARKGINVDFQWDGRDKDGNIVKSGTYFCLIKADGKKDIIKITVLK